MTQRKKLVWLAIALGLPILGATPAHGDETAPASKLVCNIGPIEKVFGKTNWLVYSCNDERSIVIATAPGSPASPFVFRFLARENSYVLQSLGTGNREFTTAAFNELKVMSGQDIETLVKLTKAHEKQ